MYSMFPTELVSQSPISSLKVINCSTNGGQMEARSELQCINGITGNKTTTQSRQVSRNTYREQEAQICHARRARCD